ncbi:M20/M25/M40 family metallo-hydrolase [Streptococcus sp. S784/96/1]|uniref:M20/M25/M40 family metallo-hydrolase n=1 Tax=Streptococcus sp. S784/96/1 TaxID=2653499 RepID=UPI001386BE09|nr:M20/M25/M40 family metallo-hydrolase [Streptococcus sp. S784/96/1]
MIVSNDQLQLEKFYNDATAQYYFDKLKELVAIKSVFAQNVGLDDAAQYLVTLFEEAGADVVLDDSFEAPFVMATFASQKADAKTLVFYNHYDVQPADSDQIWTAAPFTLDVRDGYMYGRGVDDDKGHILARLTGVQKYRKVVTELPVNIIFIIEGAEESASVDLEKYLEKYQPELSKAELLVWEQGIFNAQGQMELSGGTKGIVTFDAVVESAEVDIHSKFGGVIDSSSWYLINALSSLRTADGRILVDGIYDGVTPPTARELDLVHQFAYIESEDLRDLYDLKLPFLTDDKAELLKRLFFEPSLTIQGLSTGYQGQGVKTIIPCQASAKLEVRLVPGMEPHDVLVKIEKQLRKNGFEQVKLSYTLGEEGYRSDMTAQAILNTIDIAKKFSPKGVAVLPTTAGTGPMHQVFAALEVPIVSFGLGNPNSRDHGGDENAKLADYYTHIEMIEELIKSYE